MREVWRGMYGGHGDQSLEKGVVCQASSQHLMRVRPFGLPGVTGDQVHPAARHRDVLALLEVDRGVAVAVVGVSLIPGWPVVSRFA